MAEAEPPKMRQRDANDAMLQAPDSPRQANPGPTQAPSRHQVPEHTLWMENSSSTAVCRLS